MDKYRLQFSFDAGSGVCFWSANDEAQAKFNNYPVRTDKLPLSTATIQRVEHMIAWYERHLNWDYPPDPSPWRQEEWDAFNGTVKDVLQAVRKELGGDYEIVNEYVEGNEDPDLDYYLRAGNRPAE